MLSAIMVIPVTKYNIQEFWKVPPVVTVLFLRAFNTATLEMTISLLI